MIRQATTQDVPAVVSMSRKFYGTTDYIATEPFDADTVWDLTELLISTGVMLVAEVEGDVVGMAGALIAPGLFNRHISVATEVVWWVDPNCTRHGVGQKLFKALESHCRIKGARRLQMVKLRTSPEHVGTMYEQAGYPLSEISYTKVL